jgi:proteasome beta subunit
MSTVLGVACAGGVVIVGDRVAVTDGRIRSRSRQHVFEFGSVGAAVVGTDVDGFVARLEDGIRAYRTDRVSLGVEPFTRLASDLADEFDAAAVLAAPDDDGPVLRAVDPDGGVAADDVAAFGSGASIVLGALEGGHDPDATLAEAETIARDALSAAAERNAGTGDEFDVLRLPA